MDFKTMDSFTIPVSKQLLATLEQDGSNVQAMLSSLFDAGSTNYNQLAYELQREFRHGGSPDVIRISFDRVAYDSKAKKGRFRVILDIRFTFGCEDSVTENRNQTSEWTFSPDLSNDSISFYSSPYLDSRSTADEF